MNFFNENKRKEEEAWDMKFQNYITNLLNFEIELNKGDKDPEVLNLNINVYCERLLQHIGKFRYEWINIFETIIDDYCKSELKQTYLPVSEVIGEFKPFWDDDLDDTKIYIVK